METGLEKKLIDLYLERRNELIFDKNKKLDKKIKSLLLEFYGEPPIRTEFKYIKPKRKRKTKEEMIEELENEKKERLKIKEIEIKIVKEDLAQIEKKEIIEEIEIVNNLEEIEVVQNSLITENLNAVKKGRGRPKGSKNKII